MTTENEDEKIPLIKPIKKEKNPKRVEGGKKSVEARKLKEELKRKEAELLRKENFELKQKALNYSHITKETVSQITKENPKENPKENHITQKQKLLFFLSIGICGLGLIIYSQRNKDDLSQRNKDDLSQKVPKVPKEYKEKKEIDPFDF
jgi:hypothetical protein